MERIVNLKYIGAAIITLKVLLVTFIVYKVVQGYALNGLPFTFNSELMLFVLAGFVAQIIDGALGMAYGVSCSSLLMGFGLPPAAASASVHTSEVFTTGVSGISHLIMGNIDKKLFIRLVITGVIGAMLGAYLISQVFDGKLVKPYVSAYLLVLGIVILVKAFRKKKEQKEFKYVPALGFVGGCLDAIGGGGWGPIVTSNLIQKGHSPQLAIGTVNTAEFFVTFFSTGVFLFFTPIQYWQAILGLIIGGVIAAPLGAFIIKYIPPKTMTIMVGLLVILTSVYNIWKSYH
jgi:uncharacterized membrane protein YfcA